MKKGLENIVSKSSLSKHLLEIAESERSRIADKEDAISTFHSSEITDCPRRLLYNSTKSSKDNDAIKRFENRFVIDKWFELLGYYSKHKDLPLFDCNYNLVGNGDILLEIDYENILLKVCSVGSDDFKKVTLKGAFKKDVIELMVNEWMAEVDKGLLIYENREDFKFEIFQVHLFNNIVESIKNRCRNLMQLKIKGEMPDRPYKTDDSKECNICGHKTECWAN